MSPAEQAMLSGDWEGAFDAWATAGMDFSQADRDYMIEYSHPQGVAGSMLGSSRSGKVIDLDHVVAPVFLYYASGDVDDPDVPSISRALGTEPVVLPGEHDHAEGFNDSEAVLPLVLDFLDRVLSPTA
jgi:hypothetical protein